MHQWWYEIKKGASHVVNKVTDALDRRLEEVDFEGVAGEDIATVFLPNDVVNPTLKDGPVD